MRARDLCSTLDWEKSRLSHQLRRMQQDGLISRELNPDDARSTMVCLLPAGRAAIEAAAPGHVADVRRHFIELFSSAELDTLATRTRESCASWPKSTASQSMTSFVTAAPSAMADALEQSL